MEPAPERDIESDVEPLIEDVSLDAPIPPVAPAEAPRATPPITVEQIIERTDGPLLRRCVDNHPGSGRHSGWIDPRRYPETVAEFGARLGLRVCGIDVHKNAQRLRVPTISRIERGRAPLRFTWIVVVGEGAGAPPGVLIEHSVPSGNFRLSCNRSSWSGSSCSMARYNIRL